MRTLNSVLSRRRALLALTVATVAFPIATWAQRPPIRRVLMTTVKPDRTADFEAAAKQYNEVYAKVAGVRSRGVFQSLTGPNQYILARDYEKWADLDPGPVAKALAANSELAALNSRIRSCIESQTMLVEELVPGLSTPGRLPEPPKMIRVARSRIRPDRTAEFEAIVKSELLPAQLKAGAKSFTVRRVRFGGPTNDYYISTRLDGWADVGNDSLSKSMGDAAYKAMVSKLTALTLGREINLYRFRADLSFHAETVKTPATSASR